VEATPTGVSADQTRAHIAIAPLPVIVRRISREPAIGAGSPDAFKAREERVSTHETVAPPRAAIRSSIHRRISDSTHAEALAPIFTGRGNVGSA